jgi:hypothetical protein
MARQIGPVKITGTIDDICFYQMEGGYFARIKSSLTDERFWKEKAFAGSRRSCGLLALASPLASRLYQRLPKEKKGRPVFQQLTGKVKLLLQEGQSETAIVSWFESQYFPVPVIKKPRKRLARRTVPKQRLVVQLAAEGGHQQIAGRIRRRDRHRHDTLPRGQPKADEGPHRIPAYPFHHRMVGEGNHFLLRQDSPTR